MAPSDSGFILTLAMRPGAEHALSLIARHVGFPPDIRFPMRPVGIILIGAGDATHVQRLIRLRPLGSRAP